MSAVARHARTPLPPLRGSVAAHASLADFIWFRTGGDAAPKMDGEKPTQEPLARYSGVVKVGSDGTAKIDFDMPAFNGSVRVMGVAWSAGRTGQASADVIVRAVCQLRREPLAGAAS